MADGNNTSSNMGDGSVVVGQVRAPSTPFNSDMNPLSEFRFSGREESVTVKDVESIVMAVKESFAKFIETQRSYLDRLNDVESDKKKSTEDSDYQDDSNAENVTSATNSDGSLTKADDSDIIKEISEKSFSSTDELRNSINVDISSKMDSIGEQIIDKLLEKDESVEEEESKYISDESRNGYQLTLLDMMNSSVSSMNDRISGILKEFKDNNEISEETTSNPTMEETWEKPIAPIERELEKMSFHEIDDTTTDSASNDEELENLVYGIRNSIYEMLEDESEDIDETERSDKFDMYDDYFDDIENRQVSLSDLFAENENVAKQLAIGMNDIVAEITEFASGGLLKSMVEMYLQDSSMEIMAYGNIDEMGKMLLSNMNENFVDIIDNLRKMENDRISAFAENDNKSVPTTIEADDVERDVVEVTEILDKNDFFDNESEQENGKYENPSIDEIEKHVDGTYHTIIDTVREYIDKVISLFSKKDVYKNDENVEIDEESIFGNGESVFVDEETQDDFTKDGMTDVFDSKSMDIENDDLDIFSATYGETADENERSYGIVDDSAIFFDNMISYFNEFEERLYGKKSDSDTSAPTSFGNTLSKIELELGREERPTIADFGVKDEIVVETPIEKTVDTSSSHAPPSDDSEILDEILKSVREVVGMNERRFDRIEDMIESIPDNGSNIIIADSGEKTPFEVERIH